jgi:hypothetical protein
MILQNPYMQAGNAIRLAGDLRRAASYKKYAWSKLNQLKTMMVMSGSNMIKKYYSVEGGCVDIIVQSVAGMDSIYINACSGGGNCKLELGSVEISSLTIAIKVKMSDTKGEYTGVREYLVDWGDGEVLKISMTHLNDSFASISHTYNDTGSYDVSVKAWPRKTLNSGGGPTSPTTRKAYARMATITDIPIVTHANMIALPWALVDASTIDWDLSSGDITRSNYIFRFSGGSFGRFGSAKTEITVDLTDENVSQMVGIASIEIMPASEFPAHQIGVYKDGVFHGTASVSYDAPTTPQRTKIVDLGDVSELTTVEFKDTGDYAFLDPIGDSRITGSSFNDDNILVTNVNNTEQVKFYPYDCIKTKTLAVTVT